MIRKQKKNVSVVCVETIKLFYTFDIKMEWSNILKIVLVVIVLVVIAWFIYRRYTKPKKAPYQTNSSTDEVQVLYFVTDWCPHCKTAKPEIEYVQTELNETVVNGYKVVFQEVNCTTESPETEQLTKTYKVEGYPTIKLIKENEVIDYDAKPDRNTLKQFILTSTS